MKSNWQIKKLGEICDFQGGSQPPKSNFIYESRRGYVRFLQIRDFASDKHITYIPESKKNRLCNEDDILIGRYGASVGKILVNKKGAFNVAVMKTIPNPHLLDRKFLYYYLISDEFQSRLLKVAARSAQAGFSKDDIHDFPVLTPPLPVQERIVKALNEAFEKTAKAQDNTKKNLQAPHELFESYLHNVFANPGKNWGEKTLSDTCDFFNGKAHEKCIDEDGNYIVVNSKFISSDGRIYKRTKKQLFPLFRGDIVMVMSDVPNGKTLAKCFLIDKDETYSLNQRICAIRTKVFDKKFLYYQLNRSKYFLNFDNGENQTNLRKNDILNCSLLIPSISEQKTIAKKLDILVEDTSKLENNYEHKISYLGEFRKSILRTAFTNSL